MIRIRTSGSVTFLYRSGPHHCLTDPDPALIDQVTFKILRFLLYKCTHVYKHIPLHAEPCDACYSKPVFPASSSRSQNGGRLEKKLVIKYNIVFRK
jgi:hypothetical protein